MVIDNKSAINILVVDDIESSRILLEEILRQQGYAVSAAPDVEHAQILLANRLPDLILLDIKMPRIDGFEFCQQLKQESRTSAIPIIFISALDDSHNILHGFEAGAVDFICKPFNVQEVAARVKNHLMLRQLELSLIEKNERIAASLQQSAELQSQLMASEKMASLGRAGAGIAHELNTPMGLSVTATSYLLDKSKKIREQFKQKSLSSDGMRVFLDAVDETLEIIMTSLNRSNEMVNNFKMVAVDVSSEKLRSFCLHDYLKRVVNSLSPELNKTQHKVEITGDDLQIDSYPGALSQVITNIIMNAVIHAFEEGDKGHILIRIVQDGSNVHLNCSDDGKGMTTESLKKVFEAYYTTRAGEGGSGLGTNIIYELVTKNLQGQISCSSELGIGTMFTITLPIQLSQEQQH
jgi:signal transduction histidine kinase